MQPKAYLRLAELLMGSRITIALQVVIAKGIPDMRGDGTAVMRSFAPPAICSSHHPPDLARMLRKIPVLLPICAYDCSFSNTGLKAAVAFLSSSAGSPPEIMLVSATPKTSRNSVTATISGSPGRTMF